MVNLQVWTLAVQDEGPARVHNRSVLWSGLDPVAWLTRRVGWVLTRFSVRSDSQTRTEVERPRVPLVRCLNHGICSVQAASWSCWKDRAPMEKGSQLERHQTHNCDG